MGSLTVSWVGTVANVAAEAKSVLGALAAGASLVASCYAIAIARRKLRAVGKSGLTTEGTEDTEKTEAPAARPQKLRRKKRKGAGRIVRIAAVITMLLLTSGCTWHGKKLEHAADKAAKHREKMAEVSRALTTGVVDALSVAPAPQDPAVELAKRLATVDQEIEGLPIERLPVVEAMSNEQRAMSGAAEGSENREMEMIEAQLARVAGMRKEAARLDAAVEARQEHLVAMGVTFEQERNARIWKRWKWGSAFVLFLGALAALFVFVPVALPLAGRFLGWLVAKIPSMAGAVGVVGADAFDAVVRGVGRARAEMKNEERGAALDRSLKEETDVSHKALIDARRSALGV